MTTLSTPEDIGFAFAALATRARTIGMRARTSLALDPVPPRMLPRRSAAACMRCDAWIAARGVSAGGYPAASAELASAARTFDAAERRALAQAYANAERALVDGVDASVATRAVWAAGTDAVAGLPGAYRSVLLIVLAAACARADAGQEIGALTLKAREHHVPPLAVRRAAVPLEQEREAFSSTWRGRAGRLVGAIARGDVRGRRAWETLAQRFTGAFADIPHTRASCDAILALVPAAMLELIVAHGADVARIVAAHCPTQSTQPHFTLEEPTVLSAHLDHTTEIVDEALTRVPPDMAAATIGAIARELVRNASREEMLAFYASAVANRPTNRAARPRRIFAAAPSPTAAESVAVNREAAATAAAITAELAAVDDGGLARALARETHLLLAASIDGMTVREFAVATFAEHHDVVDDDRETICGVMGWRPGSPEAALAAALVDDREIAAAIDGSSTRAYWWTGATYQELPIPAAGALVPTLTTANGGIAPLVVGLRATIGEAPNLRDVLYVVREDSGMYWRAFGDDAAGERVTSADNEPYESVLCAIAGIANRPPAAAPASLRVLEIAFANGDAFVFHGRSDFDVRGLELALEARADDVERQLVAISYALRSGYAHVDKSSPQLDARVLVSPNAIYAFHVVA
jgi:hypothetical protein